MSVVPLRRERPPSPATARVVELRPGKAGRLAALRRRIEALERPPPRPGAAPLGFGLAEIDGALPGGGLRPCRQGQ